MDPVSLRKARDRRRATNLREALLEVARYTSHLPGVKLALEDFIHTVRTQNNGVTPAPDVEDPNGTGNRPVED